MFSVFFFFSRFVANFGHGSYTNNTIDNKKTIQICFYSTCKNKCPTNIKNAHYYGPNEYYSDIFSNSSEPIEIFVVESINLTRPLLFSSPVPFFVSGKTVIGNIELGCQTQLNIQDASYMNIKINWSVKTKQISKIITESNAKSISIKIIDQNEIKENTVYNLSFYSGKETKIMFLKGKTNNEIKMANVTDKKHQFSIINTKKYYFVKISGRSNIKEIIESGKLGDNVFYDINERNYNFYINISGFGPMYNFTKRPFKKSSINWVEIGEGVTSIGSKTFCDLNIAIVDIPETVTFIGDNAFASCFRLFKINIPESVSYIGDSSFIDCSSLEQITFPRKLTYLGSQSFSECSKLRSITIYEGITNILPNTFKKCNQLISINLNHCNKLISIQDGAFYECFNMVSLNIPESVQYIGSGAFFGCYSLKNIKIPSKVTAINNNTFYYCCKLSSINIPEAVTMIGNNAFGYCSNLESVHIHQNIEKIGNYAFLYCFKLKEFTVDAKNKHYSAIDGILSNIEQNIIYTFPPNKPSITYEIPNHVTKMTSLCFSFCTNLKHLTIPSSIEEISFGAFVHCDKLESVTILGNCTLNEQCFDQCFGLLSIVYLGVNDSYYKDILAIEYNDINVYVSNNYNSNSFCGYNVIKTKDILCRTIHHKCVECNSDSCLKCENGWKIENGKCTRDCELIDQHCAKCSSDGICLSCEKGYILEDEQCVETNICDDIIENCGVCHKSSGKFICDHCFDGFKLNSDGLTCLREINFTFAPTEFFTEPKDILNPFSNGTLTVNGSKLTVRLLFYSLPTALSYASFEIRKNINEVLVTNYLIKLELLIPPVKKGINFDYTVTKLVKLHINCPRGSIISSSKTQFPALKGSRTIEIINPANINKILLDEKDSEPLTLKSKNLKLNISLIQVRYKQKIISESSLCNLIDIESHSELTLEKMNVSTVKIGFGSNINIRNEQTKVYLFKVLPSFYNFHKIPIKFYQPFPKLDDSYIEFDETLTMDESSIKFIVAKFVGEDENSNKNACQTLKLVENNNKYHKECKKDEYGPNYNYIVTLSIKAKEVKIKIVSGAIASYAVGGIFCIVILGLSIYIIALNIKYKRCSKTHESSIDEDQI